MPIFLAVLLLAGGCKKNPADNTIKITPLPGMDLYGAVCDEDGNPIEGVVVSDGYSCTATDSKGVYQLKKNAYAIQVNISIPAAWQVPVRMGIPHFWAQLQNSKQRYDFTLSPLSGGAEKSFYLVALADPQCQNDKHVSRFTSETVPDIAKTVASLKDRPVYGITLGDIGWNNASSDYNSVNGLFPKMRSAMHKDKTAVAFFQVMGNHDNSHASVLAESAYTVDGDIANQRNFEYVFGPVNYSFNRGDVHIIGMDDVVFSNHDDYSLGFREDQIEWLRQDLSYVPKDKMIILCVHIPFGTSSKQSVQDVLELLRPYKEVHVFAGHTHYARNTENEAWYEHVHGAACGAWWNSTVNVDGTPNGYAVYSVDGATLSKWYYKGTGLQGDVQIRMHRGGLGYMHGYSPSYKFVSDASDKIFANIWNADPSWEIEVYENGNKTGNMTLQPLSSRPSDAWSAGYHVGVLGRSASTYYKTNVTHIFEYKLADPGATDIEIRAKDRFGRVYVQKEFTGNTRPFFPAAD